MVTGKLSKLGEIKNILTLSYFFESIEEVMNNTRRYMKGERTSIVVLLMYNEYNMYRIYMENQFYFVNHNNGN